jgi:hypothetical protein
MGLRAGLDAGEKKKKSHGPTGNWTPNVRSISRHYTDWAITPLSIKKANLLMLFKKIFAVYFEHHKRPINTFCE